MVASFMLVFIMPKTKGIGFILLKLTGTIGVLFAILGMYIQFFSVFPYYWFMLWFFATTIFLFENLSKRVL